MAGTDTKHLLHEPADSVPHLSAPHSKSVRAGKTTLWGLNGAYDESLTIPVRQDKAGRQPLLQLWDTGTTWGTLEPERNVWDFGHLDAEVRTARQDGYRPGLVLGQTPVWAAPSNVAPNYTGGVPAPPTRMAYWREYMTAIATRYKGQLAYVAPWNEPGLETFLVHDTPGKLAVGTETLRKLIRMQKITHDVFKRIDPKVVVTTPSFERLEAKNNFKRFLAGAKGYYDAVSYHPYQMHDNPKTMGTITRSFYSVLAAAYKHKQNIPPLWATELGVQEFTTDGQRRLTLQQTRSLIRRDIQEMNHLKVNGKHIPVAIWYTTSSNHLMATPTEYPGAFKWALKFR